jgi:hypothetical protein
MEGFESQPLERMGDTAAGGVPRYWLLDGQQRLTSLALVYRGLYQPDKRVKSPRIVSLNLRAVLESGQVEAEHFEIHLPSKWAAAFGSIDHQAKAGIVNLRDFLEFEDPNPNYFDDWKQRIDDEEMRRRFGLLKSEQLAGLFNYEFPATVIDEQSDSEMIVWIFTQVNKQAKPLQAWDLIHAKTWQQGPPEFNLRLAWGVYSDKIGLPGREDSTTWKVKYKVAEDDVLRAMKLLVDYSEPVYAKRGLSSGKILDTEAASLRAAFEGLPVAMSEVVEFLRRYAGVLPANFRPITLLPLSYVHRLERGALAEPEKYSKMLRWFWAMTFSQRYDFGQTNSLVARDATDLLSWVRSETETIPGVSDFWTANHNRIGVFDPREAARKSRKGNESLVCGVLALQVLAGAIDWSFGKKLLEVPYEELEVHHIFPKLGPAAPAAPVTDEAIEGMIVDEGFEDEAGEIGSADEVLVDEEGDGAGPFSSGLDRDIVLNLTLLFKKTNAKIRSTNPDQICSLPDSKSVNAPRPEYVESSLINIESLSDWQAFCEARTLVLEKAIEGVLPR